MLPANYVFKILRLQASYDLKVLLIKNLSQLMVNGLIVASR